MKITLSAEERERYGAPESLDCSLERLTVLEAEALEEASGLEPSDALKEMLPRREAHPDDKTKVRYRFTPKGMRLMVWLGLWRAGVHVELATLDFDYLSYAGWAVAGGEVGKDGSPDAGPSTRSTSATSSRRSRPTA